MGKLGFFLSFFLSVIMISAVVTSLIVNAYLFGVVNQLNDELSDLRQTLSSETNENHLVEAQAIYDAFKLVIRLEKNEFEIGEPIHMNIQLVNTGEENMTIVFLTQPNPNPYWFWRVYDENDQVVFYHQYCIMLGALEEVSLQPTEFMQRNCTWDQKATNSEQQVPPGIYYLTAVVSFIYNEEEVHLETRIEISIKP